MKRSETEGRCFCGRPVYRSPGSRRPHVSGLCRNHRERQRQGLPLVPVKPPPLPPVPCEKCGRVHQSRLCAPRSTESEAPPVRLDRDLKPEADVIAHALGVTPGPALVALLESARQFREETGRTLVPAADIETVARAKARGRRRAPALPPAENRVAPQVRLTPDAWEEAAEISRTLGLKHGHQAGRSATAGVRALLQAASIWRQVGGRPLTPQDIDEAARRVASRRRKGAGNGK